MALETNGQKQRILTGIFNYDIQGHLVQSLDFMVVSEAANGAKWSFLTTYSNSLARITYVSKSSWHISATFDKNVLC